MENGLPPNGQLPEGMEQAVRAEIERRQRVKEQLDHFYNGTYISVQRAEYEVMATSWKDEMSVAPVVLLSKKNRDALGVEIGHFVKVEFNGKTLPCLVERQFKGMLQGVTVNRLVAHVLGLADPSQATENPISQSITIKSLD